MKTELILVGKTTNKHFVACINDSVAADRCRSVAERAAVSFSSVDTFTFVTFLIRSG